ncbi:CD80-like immunoglobulin C2-set [Trinorchestia longiramus]|nr:CD80-like immunoglobulin C2-set [Trinorchestia longiramus]
MLSTIPCAGALHQVMAVTGGDATLPCSPPSTSPTSPDYSLNIASIRDARELQNKLLDAQMNSFLRTEEGLQLLGRTLQDLPSHFSDRAPRRAKRSLSGQEFQQQRETAMLHRRLPENSSTYTWRLSTSCPDTPMRLEGISSYQGKKTWEKRSFRSPERDSRNLKKKSPKLLPSAFMTSFAHSNFDNANASFDKRKSSDNWMISSRTMWREVKLKANRKNLLQTKIALPLNLKRLRSKEIVFTNSFAEHRLIESLIDRQNQRPKMEPKTSSVKGFYGRLLPSPSRTSNLSLFARKLFRKCGPGSGMHTKETSRLYWKKIKLRNRRSNSASSESSTPRTPVLKLVSVYVGERSVPETENQDPGQDKPILVLWYKDDVGTPFYSFDSRDADDTSSAMVWAEPHLLGPRAQFDINTQLLTIRRLKVADEGIYRCRLEYKTAATTVVRANLTVIVPPAAPVITEGEGSPPAEEKEVHAPFGPYAEGDSVTLTCFVKGGHPAPRLEWYLGSTLLDRSYTTTATGVTLNALHVAAVSRRLAAEDLQCVAILPKIDPIATKANVHFHLSPLSTRILGPRTAVTAGVEQEVLCVVRGAVPPAAVRWYLNGVPVQARHSEKCLHVSMVWRERGFFVLSCSDVSCAARHTSLVSHARVALGTCRTRHVSHSARVALGTCRTRHVSHSARVALGTCRTQSVEVNKTVSTLWWRPKKQEDGAVLQCSGFCPTLPSRVVSDNWTISVNFNACTTFSQCLHYTQSMPALRSVNACTTLSQCLHYAQSMPALRSVNACTTLSQCLHYAQSMPTLRSVNAYTTLSQCLHYV